MKYRIFYENNRWHVREPGGCVTWHFDSLDHAADWAVKQAKATLQYKAELQMLDSMPRYAVAPRVGDRVFDRR